MKMKKCGALQANRLAFRRRPTLLQVVAPLLAAVLVAGCASTQIGAQWTDPQWPKQSLQGTTVLVVCDAQDTTVRLLCESRFSARLAALGAKPVTPQAGEQSDGQPASQATLSAARSGARSASRPRSGRRLRSRFRADLQLRHRRLRRGEQRRRRCRRRDAGRGSAARARGQQHSSTRPAAAR
jgi:hypothetical protein